MCPEELLTMLHLPLVFAEQLNYRRILHNKGHRGLLFAFIPGVSWNGPLQPLIHPCHLPRASIRLKPCATLAQDR